MLEQNNVKLSGRLLEEYKVSHTTMELNYFKNTLIVERTSGVEDEIPIIIPETLLYHGGVEGRFAIMEGDIRTYTEKHQHLAIVFFVKKVQYNQEGPCENLVKLKGRIFRKSFYECSKGAKVDFMVQVLGNFGKTSDVPCVAYDETAKKIADLEIGDEVSVKGRLQSRKYFKGDEMKETYEVFTKSIGR